MNKIGISKKIDSLGRIVIPKDLRPEDVENYVEHGDKPNFIIKESVPKYALFIST